MIPAGNKPVPEDILKDSLLAHVAAAYFAVGKRLERKTQCSATRGFILSALRGGARLNQNQIAVRLGLDRTVVHRAIKAMVQESLVSEKKAPAGKALLVQLTAKGAKYREQLIKARRAADEKLRHELSPEDQAALLRLLKIVTELEF
jgi:DNA-binding MarR family transcriptional regulator